MMHKMFLLMLAAVFCGGLPAQDMGGMAELLALFNSHPKADIAVELVKKYEGLHDRSDYPCYGYGHRRLPNENLSYDMTEEEAETLLRKDLAVLWVKGYCSVTADTRKAGSSASWKPGTGTFTRNTSPSAVGKASPSAR